MLPILSLKIIDGKTFCVVSKDDILKVITFLKNYFGFQFKVLTMISGTDFPHQVNRFEVAYELLSIKYNTRLKVKCFSHEASHIPSIFSIFASATWWEREIWDLLGVYFVNNPDLRRILTDYGFLGNPLRKDFPLTGFTETYYDSTSKTVSYNFVETSQKQRFFISYSPNLDV
jgi:NADH/F420H2 dehydrogenase subunit C